MMKKFSALLVMFLLINPLFSQENPVDTSLSEKEKILNSNDSLLPNVSSESRYGFAALWNQSDWVAKAALLILLIMSLGTWTIFIAKFFEQRKTKNECIKVNKYVEKDKYLIGKIFEELPNNCLLHVIHDAGKNAKIFSSNLDGPMEPAQVVGDAIQNGVNDVNEHLQRGLTFLATVGSTAPFVGLFGTVWAIYHALIKIGDSGQATLDKVAGPVGEALIMTAIGLAVAVPAVLGYNWLLRRNKELMNIIGKFSGSLYIYLFSKGV